MDCIDQHPETRAHVIGMSAKLKLPTLAYRVYISCFRT